MKILFSIVLGSLFGGLPVAYIIGKVQKGIDLRKVGSGNLGATNVLRNLGVFSFILCVIFDVGKAYFAFKLAQRFFGDVYGPISGFATVLGHCYSPFMNFKGGKGVATSGGLILAYDWRIFLIATLFLFALLLITRRMSIGSIGSAIIFPILYYYYYGFDLFIIGAIILSGFVIFMHRENISRIIKGTEPKLF